MSYGNNENVIEFLIDSETATVSLTQRRYKSKVERLAEKYPDDVKIISRNEDGSLCAHLPISFIKINPPKKMSESQIETARKNMRKLHDKLGHTACGTD